MPIVTFVNADRSNCHWASDKHQKIDREVYIMKIKNHRIIGHNRPISTVIKWFVDKESGHVSEARKEIRRRFSGVDWKYQKKILLASLASCETDRTWAYPKLLDCWEDSFAPIIEDLWNTYHEKRCSWVIIRFFPKEYIRANMDNLLVDERNYYFICRRMADEEDFVIDPKLFWNVEDYFKAMAICHRMEETSCQHGFFKILSIRDISRCNTTRYLK